MNAKKLLHFLSNIELYICDVLLALTIVVATLGVIFRYFLNDSLTWSEEVCRYSFVWISMLSTGYAVMNGGHLYVDLLTGLETKFPVMKKYLRLVVTVIWLGFCVYFAKQGWQVVSFTMEHSAALSIPMNLVYAAIPVGCVIMAIRLVQKTFIDYFPKKPDTEAGGGTEGKGE